MQHCTDLHLQVAFPAHTEQGKTGPGFRMNVVAHQEKEKNEKSKTNEREERKQATNFKEAACRPSAVV